MSIAPNGREGIFTALASAPLFAAMLPTGMISGALLQAYCPDNGQCAEREEEGDGGASRRLLGLMTGRGLAAPGDPEPYSCNGRMLWTIVGLITLSSPLMVLLTQRWVRPAAGDFARLEGTHRPGPLTEGECFDVNDADPTVVLENVFESSLLHAAESGSASGTAGVGTATGATVPAPHASTIS